MDSDNPWGHNSPSPAATPIPLSTPPALKLNEEGSATSDDGFDWDAGGDIGVSAQDEPAIAGETTTEEIKENVLDSPSLAAPRYEAPPMDEFDEDDDPSTLPPTDATQDGDEFDDFGEPATEGGGGDDDDFGDFEETDASAFEPVPVQPIASTSTGAYPPLRIQFKGKSRAEIGLQLRPFLDSVWPNARSTVSDEPERQVEGLGQVLVTESSRKLLQDLSSLPPLRPLDWRRSRFRREHLISLGVPVNLDESTESKPLNPLVSSSQPSSPSPFSSNPRSSSPTPFSNPTTIRRNGTPQPPLLDRKKATELLSIPSDDLPLMGLEQLRKLKGDLERISIDASGALTHALLKREKEVGDGETYNGMIQDLVTAAAKMKTSGGAALSLSRSSSGKGRWGSSSSGRKSSGGPGAMMR